MADGRGIPVPGGNAMKFGLFYELSVPRPWTRESERTVYNNALEQVKLADELGFDQVWAVEHHFLEEYSHCPAPELFLTACAMVTQKIRVGHGIVVCVPEFNHPIKIAERTAVLDILSGRPPGSGHRPLRHLDRAGRLPRRSGHHQEVLGRVRPLPAEDVDAGDLCLRGRVLVHARADASFPRCTSSPHPPMWVAVTSPGTELDAADRGLGSPRPHLRPVRRAGAPHRRVSPAHPALRAGGRLRQRPGQHGELPLLPRGRRARARHRQAHGGLVQLPRLPAHLRPRGLSRRAPIRRWASCPSSAARPPGPTPASRRARGWRWGDPSASSARSRSGRRWAWTG